MSSTPVAVPSRHPHTASASRSGATPAAPASSARSYQSDSVAVPAASFSSLLSGSLSRYASPATFSSGSLRSGVPLYFGKRQQPAPQLVDIPTGQVLPAGDLERVPLLQPGEGTALNSAPFDGGSLNSPGGKRGVDAAGGSGGPAPAANTRAVLVKGVMFGLINSVILIPVMVSFAQIIFRDPYFTPSMPYLVKLVLLSSIVHQICFTCFSTLPFAIGQVQDAGLIFLSAMSSSIVRQCLAHHSDHDELMATTLCWLGISTALLGMALYATGKLRLAGLVQYLPMPVVGGYLAFIGFYCLLAALSLMSGEEVSTVRDLGRIFHRNAILLCLPGLVTGGILMAIVRRFRHYAVLPCCLLVIPIAFHIALAAAGVSLEEATTSLGNGWLAKHTPPTKFWQSWEHYQFSKVYWQAIPAQIPTWLAMYFVVSFSSCLDVAAIQMELGSRLDFNHELKTVGLSNFVSGATGGFTGSYIFSQTIFTMRANIQSRIVGIVVIAVCSAFFFVPISVLEFIPKFFFGAILTFIAMDLMLEWLIHSFHLLRPIEYAVVWATFIAISGLNLEYGMLCGIGIAILLFILQYSTVKMARPIKNRSNVIRGFSQRQIVAEARDSIVALQLEGFVFFGSAVRILKDVKHSVWVPVGSGKLDEGPATPGGVMRLSDQDHQEIPGLESVSNRAATQYLVLDFSRVSGMDATAVRSCFVSLDQDLRQHNIAVLYTNVSRQVAFLLRAHGLVVLGEEEGILHDTLDEGLEWCEDDILMRKNVKHPRRLSMDNPTLLGILRAYSRSDPSEGDKEVAAKASRLEAYFDTQHFDDGEVVFAQGDTPDAVYFILEGEVLILRAAEGVVMPQGITKRRMLRFDQGGTFGQLEYFLGQPRMRTATVVSQTTLLRLTRPKFEAMTNEAPELALHVESIFLKAVCQTVADALW